MAEWALDPGVRRVTMTSIAMAISIHSNPLFGIASAEHRLQAALVDVTALQAEVDRTYETLEQIERERAERDYEPGCCQTQLDDVRFQLSEVVAIGAERRALQRDTAVLVAQMGALQEQHLELQLRMAALKRHWVAREITSAAARQASLNGQPDEAELTCVAPRQAVACLA